MSRKINEETEDIIINFGAFGYQPEKMANILGWTFAEVDSEIQNKESSFYKLYAKGRDTADYVIDLKLFDLAKTGDLKALEEFEARRD